MSNQQALRGTWSSATLPSTPPAEEWQAAWARTIPELARVTRRLGPAAQQCDVSIMRSSQLDAARLDDELTGMLREQFLAGFQLFRPAAIARLQPELTLLLDLLIFRFSIWEGRPLPGMALMNLRHRDEAAVQRQQRALAARAHLAAAGADAGGSLLNNLGSSRLGSSSGSGFSSNGGSGGGSSSGSGACGGPGSGLGSSMARQLAGGHSGVEGPDLSPMQRGLYGGGAVLLRYAWARLGQHAAAQHWGDDSAGSDSWRRRCWVLMRQAESGYRLASLANFLAFLRWGHYRSLLERLLQARLVYQQPSAARAVSFEYLNRQLVWSELSELLLFVLPLLNVKAITHTLRSYLPRLPILSAAAGSAAAAGGGGGGGHTGLNQQQQQQQPCGICSAPEMLSPWEAKPCGHLFCYYCLRSHCLADEQYSCPLCLLRVQAMQPWVARDEEDKAGGDGGGGSGSSGG